MFEPTQERLDASEILKKSVVLLTEVADPELAALYDQCLFTIYPSHYEGWGLPVTEALACGTPVITTTESSLPEAAGEAGLCLPPLDIPGWTAALARAIHDPEWRRDRGTRGQIHAAQFSWARTAEQTVASYRRAMAK